MRLRLNLAILAVMLLMTAMVCFAKSPKSSIPTPPSVDSVQPADPVQSVQPVQSAGSTSTNLPGRWEADLPGGSFVVSVSKIASVSTSEYIVDAAARVTELTIGTTSSVTARFYYIEPIVQNDRAQQLMDKIQGHAQNVADHTGQDAVWQKVVKNYPLTTHAHTVEYRLSAKEQVQSLFNSVNTALSNNGNTVIRITE